MFNKRALLLITLMTIATFSIFIITNNTKVYADSPVNATFTTQNTAPGLPTNMTIQDFPTHFDAFDYIQADEPGDPLRHADTHWRAGYGPAQGPNLTWTEGFDAEQTKGDVRTLFCISSTAAGRNSATPVDGSGCDIMQNFTSFSIAIEPDSIILSPLNGARLFNSTVGLQNRTLYLRFATTDGTLVAGNYDTNITIVNSPPDPNATGFRTQDAFNPNDANTHDPNPIINWTDSSDKDDGLTIDHYPADDLDYFLFVGNTPAVFEKQRIAGPFVAIKNSQLNFSEALSAEWDQILDLSGAAIVDGYANKTYYYTIVTNDQYLNSTAAQGSFDYWDFLPRVRTIAITQSPPGAPMMCDQGSCTITPSTHSNATGINFNVTILDIDGDACTSANYNARVRLCLNNTAASPLVITCNDQLSNFSFRLDRASPAGVPNQCNLSMSLAQGPQPSALAPQGTPPFFFQPSQRYRIFANISNIVNITLPGDTNATQNWTYNTLLAATFLNEKTQETQNVSVGGDPAPAANTISSGIITYNMTNWGNAQYDLQWNTSSFANDAGPCGVLPGGVWTPDATNFFRVDDDGYLNGATAEPGIPAPQGGTGNLLAVDLSASFASYQFAGGLRRCISYNCNNFVNETLMHFWHIFPPAGLCAGNWKATLRFVSTALPGQ